MFFGSFSKGDRDMGKKMIVKVMIDLENQKLGVSKVQLSSNTNIKKLLPMGGATFLSMVFQQLSDQYKEKAKLN